MNRKHIIRNLRLKCIVFDNNLSTAELQALLVNAQNKFCKAFDYAGGRGKLTVTYNAAKAEDPAEIMMCDEIGKDAWTGEGISVKDIQNALDAITPKTRPLNFLVNSPGGMVNEGCAIRNILNSWAGVINKTIIGVAASTAAWCIPADTTKAYKNSQVFLHRSMAYVGGNVDDLTQAIEYLNTTDGQIADMLANDSDGEPDAMLDLMKKESLLTGQQAMDLGLVDELIDGNAMNQFSVEWLNSARQKLAARNSLSALPTQGERKQTNNKTQEENMKEKIALLNKRGITVPANATEVEVDALIARSDFARTQNINILNVWKVTVPENATDADILALVANGKPVTAPAPATALSAADQQVLTDLRNQLSNSRKREIQTAVEKAASEGKIAVNEIESWVTDAVAVQDNPTTGNSVLNRLNKLEARQPGIAPLPLENTTLEVTNASIQDIARGFKAHNDSRDAWKRGLIDGEQAMKTLRNDAVAKANFFKKFRNRLIEVFNANTIDAGLQRQVIMQDVVIRDFARRVIGLTMFSTVFRDVPLQGLHTVEVPYYDLDTSASQSFASATGYNTVGNTVSSKREITIGQGPNDNGGFNVGHNRAYQMMQFTSQEIARQPYLKVAELAGLKAEKLAFDIFQDALSVITVANYGAASIVKPANQIDSDQIALLKLACKAWPQMGRGLIVDSSIDANLLQDPSFKYALNAASDLAIKEGRLFPRVMGFDYLENPNISNLANPGIANLIGFAVWKYAILVAFAPVPPVEEVRNSGTTWELFIDPPTGISLEYRQFGNNILDQASNIVESNYGFAKGLGTALKTIVSA